ncbi:MAG: GHKL domain-containing protein, partial [Bacteroidia bacterium]|nr:GHKL domain-containing protein [Bacteroidia bacterium]
VMAMKNEQQLGLIEMEFNMKQKETEIEYLRRDAEIQNDQLFWQRIVIAVFAIVFVIVMSLIVMLRKQNRIVKQANESLELKNKTISNQSEELLTTIDTLHTTQAQLLHAEKMASLGVLTAGIAHELNNPLNFIFGGTQALSYTHQELKEEVEKGNQADLNKMMSIIQDLKSLESSISNGVARTTEIINSMRTFSGPQTGLPEDFTVSISECVESTLVLMASKLKDTNVNVVRDFAPVPKVRVNTSQMNQCILNLLDNAIDALERAEGDKLITIRIFSEQGRTLVSIIDNGIGIPADIQPRVMEAFFTTKAPGKGTGLGLFICYNIIQQHDGELTFRSKPGESTAFTISLPTTWA